MFVCALKRNPQLGERLKSGCNFRRTLATQVAHTLSFVPPVVPSIAHERKC
nr:MAG TPA: hypothetical protein [Caudoviricetes sp.]DAZ65140.1 MAG TPA: hypothetical protein [Caudoviricetes sp.]